MDFVDVQQDVNGCGAWGDNCILVEHSNGWLRSDGLEIRHYQEGVAGAAVDPMQAVVREVAELGSRFAVAAGQGHQCDDSRAWGTTDAVPSSEGSDAGILDSEVHDAVMDDGVLGEGSAAALASWVQAGQDAVVRSRSFEASGICP